MGRKTVNPISEKEWETFFSESNQIIIKLKSANVLDLELENFAKASAFIHVKKYRRLPSIDLLSKWIEMRYLGHSFSIWTLILDFLEISGYISDASAYPARTTKVATDLMFKFPWSDTPVLSKDQCIFLRELGWHIKVKL